MNRRSRYDELRAEVRAFHQAHPEVWAEFVAVCQRELDKGITILAVNKLWNDLRWETRLADGELPERFKLNSNYAPFYARRFVYLFPEHKGCFRFRRQRSRDAEPSDRDPLGPPDFPYENPPQPPGDPLDPDDERDARARSPDDYRRARDGE